MKVEVRILTPMALNIIMKGEVPKRASKTIILIEKGTFYERCIDQKPIKLLIQTFRRPILAQLPSSHLFISFPLNRLV